MLRRAREARGLTEQQAAEMLNLDASSVLALEGDDLAALGAPVFARGHLRRYGALLGLADDELLAAYERAKGRPNQPSLVPRSRGGMAPVRRGPGWPWVVGGALLFMVVAGLIAYVSEYGFALPQLASAPATAQEPAVAEPPTVTVAADAGADPGEDAGAVQSDAPAAPGGGDAAGSAAVASEGRVAPVVPPGHVSVSVSFAADSWAEIYDGSGQAVLYDLGRAGTQRTFAAAAPLSVTIGNASGVTLTVNGRPMELRVPAGQSVARFTIGADGSLH